MSGTQLSNDTATEPAGPWLSRRGSRRPTQMLGSSVTRLALPAKPNW
jgi:hypothetical protein